MQIRHFRSLGHRVTSALFFWAFMLGTAGAGDIRPIEGPAELEARLATARPGTELRLAAGDYGALELRDMAGTPSAPVIIRSGDPTHPARFSRVTLKGSRHIRLEDIAFDYRFSRKDPPHLRPFELRDCEDITLRRVLIDGDLAQGFGPKENGFPHAYGLSIRDSHGITVEDSEIRTFIRGMVTSQSRGITVRRNDLHDLRSDGMNFAEVQDVLIEGNHFHDFSRSPTSGDHADMIQFWTNGTNAPTHGVIIRGNLLTSGDGLYTQSIFMRNEEVDTGRAGPEMLYRDILIEENLIINAHLHGITLGEADGVVIRRNTLVRNPGSAGEKDNYALWTPRITVKEAARNVRIEGNVTAAISGFQGQPDWTVRNNLLVQDRHRMTSGFYGRVFQGGDPRDPASFTPLPGGPLDGTGVGVSWAAPAR